MKKTTYVIHMPPGISQKHFEAKKEELEQYFNGKIEFGFNKELIMTVSENLKTNYPYVFKERKKPLEVLCGYSHKGKFYLDIASCPHLIIAGATGWGKSSFMRNIILTYILNSHNIELYLVDFQAVELGIFEDCKKVKLYTESAEDFGKLLNELEEENKRRLSLFRSVKNKVYIENIQAWNSHFPERALPYKVIFVEEFATLAEGKNEEIFNKFRTRAGVDRKVGFHYICSILRPDVKTIDGNIKSNFPARLACKTVSQKDSEVILDVAGAEKINIQGRCLFNYCGEIHEIQSLYVQNNDVRGILKKHKAYKTDEEKQLEKRLIEAKEKEERKNHIKKWQEKNKGPYGG